MAVGAKYLFLLNVVWREILPFAVPSLHIRRRLRAAAQGRLVREKKRTPQNDNPPPVILSVGGDVWLCRGAKNLTLQNVGSRTRQSTTKNAKEARRIQIKKQLFSLRPLWYSLCSLWFILVTGDSRMRKTIIFCLFIAAAHTHAQQDYENWLKEQQKQAGQFAEQEQKKFKQFKDERDSAFVEFLKKEWLAFVVFKGVIPDETPKPVIVPKTTPKSIPKEMVPEPSEVIKEIHMPEEGMIKVSESIEVFISKLKKEGDTLPFSFFDASLEVNYDKAMSKAKLENPVDQDKISSFWADLSRSKYDDLLDQTKKLKDRMKLNDWGYCLLLNQISKGLYPDSENKRNLFIWFMLAKSGYDAKAGYDENEVVLLLPSVHVIYRTPYFVMGSKKYYVASFDRAERKAKSIYTYEGSYPDALRLIALDIENPPLIRQGMENKELKFRYGDKEYVVHFDIKRDAIDFYSEYPQTDYEVYFDASLSPEARYSLANALRPIIEGKTEAEAVNMLLRFVQTAFEYKNDEVQFGREKPFFAEETLFYPYSDCEDRAVLFAYLVRTLLGLEVIGLDYPGHISTAVKFSTNIKGNCIEYNGNKYIICDATYINANIGQCLTKYRNVKPNVIKIKE